MVQFINMQSLIGMAQLAMGFNQGPVSGQELFELLGLKNVKHYASVSGLDKENYCSRALLATDGAPTGLLGQLGSQPITAESLALVPADASFAVAARIDANKLTDGLIGLLALLDARAAGDVRRDLD